MRSAPSETAFCSLGGIETTELSEIAARAKLIFPIALEWRNWQTQQTQNLPPVTRHGGSTPPSSTKFVEVQGSWRNLRRDRVAKFLVQGYCRSVRLKTRKRQPQAGGATSIPKTNSATATVPICSRGPS